MSTPDLERLLTRLQDVQIIGWVGTAPSDDIAAVVIVGEGFSELFPERVSAGAAAPPAIGSTATQ
jgi:hypothetical protein